MRFGWAPATLPSSVTLQPRVVSCKANSLERLTTFDVKVLLMPSFLYLSQGMHEVEPWP